MSTPYGRLQNRRWAVGNNYGEPPHSPIPITASVFSGTGSSTESLTGDAFAGLAVTVAAHSAFPRSTTSWLTCASDG